MYVRPGRGIPVGPPEVSSIFVPVKEVLWAGFPLSELRVGGYRMSYAEQTVKPLEAYL